MICFIINNKTGLICKYLMCTWLYAVQNVLGKKENIDKNDKSEADHMELRDVVEASTNDKITEICGLMEWFV